MVSTLVAARSCTYVETSGCKCCIEWWRWRPLRLGYFFFFNPGGTRRVQIRHIDVLKTPILDSGYMLVLENNSKQSQLELRFTAALTRELRCCSTVWGIPIGTG